MKRTYLKSFVIIAFSILLLSGVVVPARSVFAVVTKNWSIDGDYSLFNSGKGGKDVGVVQGLFGSSSNLSITTSDSTGKQAARIVFPGGVDAGETVFYSGKKGAETPVFKIGGTGTISWGDGKAMLRNDQGGSIEIGGKGTPYLDFKNDTAADYDSRFILIDNDRLELRGSDLRTMDAHSIGSENTANASNVMLGWQGNQARIRVGGDGSGASNGLSIQQVGNAEIIQFDESGGVAKITSGYGTICIGKC